MLRQWIASIVREVAVRIGGVSLMEWVPWAGPARRSKRAAVRSLDDDDAFEDDSVD